MRVQRASLIVVSILAFGVGALPVTDARAASTVAGPTFCQPTNGVTGFQVQYTTGGIQNIAGRAIDIICTLFRDNTTNTNGLSDLEVAIKIDPAFPGTFTCVAAAVDRKGDWVRNVTKSKTSTGIIDFGNLLNFSVTKGHYALRCSMPTNATLHSIYYLEP